MECQQPHMLYSRDSYAECHTIAEGVVVTCHTQANMCLTIYVGKHECMKGCQAWPRRNLDLAAWLLLCKYIVRLQNPQTMMLRLHTQVAQNL